MIDDLPQGYELNDDNSPHELPVGYSLKNQPKILQDDHIESASVSPKTGQDAGPGYAYGEGLANSVPFGQRITSGLAALGSAALSKDVGFKDIPDLYNQAQENTKTTAQANPSAAGAGSATGIIGSLPIGGIGADWVTGANLAKNAPIISRFGHTIGQGIRGATIASPTMAAYNAGTTESIKDMPSAVLHGGELGAGIGFATPTAIIPAVGGAIKTLAAVSKPLSNAIYGGIKYLDEKASLMGNGIAQNPAQVDIIRQVMQHPDAPQIIERAKNNYSQAAAVGIPITLGEALGNHSMMAKIGQMANDPSTEGQVREFFDSRVQKQIPAALQTLSDKMGKWQSVDEAASEVGGAAGSAIKKIKNNLSASAAPFYEKAYSSPAPTEKLYTETLLGKESIQDAMKAAEKTAAEEQVPITDLFTEVKNPNPKMVKQMVPSGQLDMYGQPIMKEVSSAVDGTLRIPTVRGWDYIKRGLDDNVNQLYSSNDKMRAIAVQKTRDMLRDSMKIDVPGYEQALETYSHNASEDLPKIQNFLGDLADAGKNPEKIINAPFSGTPQRTQDIAAHIGPEASSAAAKGSLLQAMGKNTGETDLAVPSKVKYGSDWAQQQFKTLLGDKFPLFDSTMQTIQKAAQGTKKLPEVGSQTAERNSAKEAIDGISALKNPFKVLSSGLDYIAGRSSPEYKRDMANALVSKDGQDLVERLSKSKTMADKRKAMEDLNDFLKAKTSPEGKASVGPVKGKLGFKLKSKDK